MFYDLDIADEIPTPDLIDVEQCQVGLYETVSPELINLTVRQPPKEKIHNIKNLIKTLFVAFRSA
jgi:hypothetical protein